MANNDFDFFELLDFLSAVACRDDETDEDDDANDSGADYAVVTIDDLPFDDPCDMDCSLCENKCDDYLLYGKYEVPYVQEIIFNPPATIIKWIDGTKTVVKCSKNDRYDKYLGFAAAVVKKMFGSGSQVDKFIRSVAVPEKENKKD